MSAPASFSVALLQLRFSLEAIQPIHLGPQAGAQLRGALWSALRSSACTSPGVAPHELAKHSQHCPMCRLLHLENWPGERGVNPARPLAIRPPLSAHPESDHIFSQGEIFNLELSLFGDAIEALRYVVKGMLDMGEIGVGYHRGRFRLSGVEALNPLNDQSQNLMPRPHLLLKPQLTVTASDVETYANALNPKQLRLRFLTPTQLTAQGQPVNKPTLAILIGRLLERCQSLAQTYTSQDTPQPDWRNLHLKLSALATEVHSLSSTRWVRIESGSRRISERNAMGGFVGDLILEGDLKPFLPWLVWGSLLHVGKNAVKGGGWYEIL